MSIDSVKSDNFPCCHTTKVLIIWPSLVESTRNQLYFESFVKNKKKGKS